MTSIRYYLLGLAGGLFLPTLAQQAKNDTAMSKVVVVENEYRPEISRAEKMNFTPVPEVPATGKQAIDYLTNPSVFKGQVFTPAQDYSTPHQPDKAHPFYIRLGYGTRHHIDARLSYAGMIGKKDYLQAGIFGHGFNGKLDLISPSTDILDKKWGVKAMRYGAGADYRHYFPKLTLLAGLNAMLEQHDFLPRLPLSSIDESVAKQSDVNRFSGYLGIESDREGNYFRYALTGGFSTFNYQTKTERNFKGHETDIYAQGFIATDVNRRQFLRIDFRTDYLLHNLFLPNQESYKNYALLRFNPHYQKQTDNWRLRMGAHSDWQVGFHNRLMLAPDIRFDWFIANGYQAFVGIDGGSLLNNSSRLHDRSIYGMSDVQLTSTYIPYDFFAGIKSSFLPGLGTTLSAHYTSYKNQLFVLPSDGRLFPNQNWNYSYVEFLQRDAKVFRLHLDAAYDWKDRLHIGLEGNWMKWQQPDADDLHLFLAPQWNLRANTRFRLPAGFNAIASYTYEKRMKTHIGYFTPDVNKLDLGAEYDGLKDITVFVHFKNVLNQKFFTEYGYPEQRFFIIGGLSVQF